MYLFCFSCVINSANYIVYFCKVQEHELQETEFTDGKEPDMHITIGGLADTYFKAMYIPMLSSGGQAHSFLFKILVIF